MKRLIIMTCTGALVAAVMADTYQFIISGYPAANESYAVASAGTSLTTATRTVSTAAAALEARFRTRDGSVGISLRSDKVCGLLIRLK